ncbi:hypothetical protein HYH02_008619 [Chlamydomonas schloesseri]|uniref:Non-canonical E2 ubiquitin-conjugating enzyme C-terminal domain-containing protein n=1 Tax=Chlamydomonas schloesseri TaxID=2026947 RepID=A0A835WD22_9CHLO|nr:hypothetical protein HYH02_008619 [Chlamydomonas schloesseri]|eukprot:KAG2445151.1 hypothetical protein HYH02_008619 [Chlamydomonas schloesseri]
MSQLAHVLDAADGDADHAQPGTNGGEPGPTTAYEDHVARLKAEAEAQDAQNRLRVAQEQLAEYAAQKEADANDLLQEAEKLKDALRQLLEQPGSTAGELQQVAQLFNTLREKVVDAVTEARAFAAQQQSDLATLKRSSAQADLHTDVEMKRARDEPGSSGDAEEAEEEDEEAEEAERGTIGSQPAGLPSTSFAERARYIPLRLTHDERKLLRLLESALNVSEYTDKVDILSWRSKNQRIHAQIKDLCAILSGLMVAADYKKGQELIRDRNFADNAEFFQDIFELGRRYKILNPDKMRSEYGKLMYMLMDSAEPAIQELLEFRCVRQLRTVYVFLEERGGLAMLEDAALMHTATAEIVAGDRPRHEIQRDIKVKEKARETLSRRYRSSRLSEEDILTCIYSLSDNNSYLLFNRDPIDRFIHYFHRYFKADTHEPGYSLAIQGGRDGARLTHNHERQYHYVLQSLTLWREISTEMFKLWYLAETDMLREGNHYRLCDTGQGLNRVQSAPSVGRAMQQILGRVQQRIGSWVGSSVVHLGDHNVPNALMFIDKYTQVPRILNPVVAVLEELPKLYRDPNLRAYIDGTFGGVEQCRKSILVDFCRHAFDGSGADNFFDAGSCIDGRLTSAWNWCSKLEKKSYYHVFKLAGWSGFDGEVKS